MAKVTVHFVSIYIKKENMDGIPEIMRNEWETEPSEGDQTKSDGHWLRQ